MLGRTRASAAAAGAAAASSAAALLLAALAFNAGNRQEQGGASQLLAAFGADGTIRADTVRKWHKAVENDGAFPFPENSFFDATNSDVWGEGSTEGKETSWLKPGQWVSARRGGASEQNDRFTSDAHSEYQDGQWWPYELGVGPSAEAKRVKEAEEQKHGVPASWKDLYKAVVRRYLTFPTTSFPPTLAHERAISALLKVLALASRSFSIFLLISSAFAPSGKKQQQVQQSNR